MTSFHELYESYARDVYRFALYLSGDHAFAEDVTSETFIRVWSSKEPVRFATVKAYLLTIARNLCLMDRRRSSRLQVLNDALPTGIQACFVTSRFMRSSVRCFGLFKHFPRRTAQHC